MEILQEFRWTRSPRAQLTLAPDRRTLVPLLRQTALRRIRLNNRPGDLAFDGQHMWIANEERGEVFKVDVLSEAVQRIPLSQYVYHHTFGVAFDGESVWISAGPHWQLVKMDIVTHAPIANFALGAEMGLGQVVFDGNRIWAATRSAPHGLWGVYAETNRVDGFLEIGAPVRDLAFDGRYVWVAADALYRFNGGSWILERFTDLTFSPRRLAFDGGTGLWVTGSSFQLALIDVESNAIVFSDQVGTVEAMAHDGTHLWMAMPGESVAVLDPATRAIVRRVGVPYLSGARAQARMAFDGTHMWLTHPEWYELVSKIPVIPFA